MHAVSPKVPVLTLATRVTLLRILGIPVFVLLMQYYLLSLAGGAPEEYFRVAALVTFAAVALTDALDGYLARSRHEITALGRVLDPLADKALMLSALLLLTRPSLPALQPQLPVWFTLTLVSRDVLLLAGVLVVHHFSETVHIEPRLAGKVSTALQMGLIVWVLADGPTKGFLVTAIVAVACALWAGLQYLHEGLRQIDASHRHPTPKP